MLLGVGGHSLAGFFACEAGPFAGILEDAVVGEGLLHGRLVGERAIDRTDHGSDGDAVLSAELEVALVVRGDGHDRAGAVFHQHKVADPDGDALGAIRIESVEAGEEADLLDVRGVLGVLGLPGGGAHGGGSGEILRERMLRRENHAGGAVDGVDSGGEDADGLGGPFEVEIDLGAVGAADPVALHLEDAVGPAAFELRDVGEQFVGITRDAEEPLLELALLDGRGFMAPAAAIDHLFVGEHGAALRAPVDLGLAAVGQVALEHFEEEPLVPAVIVGLAGGDFAVPVVAEGVTGVGLLHLRDVGPGPVARVQAALDGGVLGGKTEGVPSHGVEHVEAAHPFVSGKGVADGVVAQVAHVQGAAGVGQHFEHVILGLGGVLLSLVEGGHVLPALEPLQFDGDVVVDLLGHCLGRRSLAARGPSPRRAKSSIVAEAAGARRNWVARPARRWVRIFPAISMITRWLGAMMGSFGAFCFGGGRGNELV